MCGRYVSVAARADLEALFGATGGGGGKDLSPSWNVAPTSKVHVVASHGPELIEPVTVQGDQLLQLAAV